MTTSHHTVALIGAGGIAAPHLRAWTALGAEVRVFSEAGAQALTADVPTATPVATLEQALQGADIVDVCTPTDTHAEIVARALDAGADVLGEKPLARTSADAAALVAQAERLGRKLMPAHVVRWFPAYERAQAGVAAGDLGELAVLRFSRTGAGPSRDWFHDVVRSGGIVMDQMIHDIDQALWLAGPVRELAAVGASGPRPVQTVQLVLEHRSGALSYVTGTWGPPGTTFRTTFEIAGTDGLLQHDSTAHPELRLDAAAAGESTGLLPPVHGTSPYHREIEAFQAWVDGGDPPPLEPADGVRAVAVAEAALRALERGDVVAVDEEVAA